MGRPRKSLNQDTDSIMSEENTGIIPEEIELSPLPDEIPEVMIKNTGIFLKENTEIAQTIEKFGDYTAEIIRDTYTKADITYIAHKDPNYAYRFLFDHKENLDLKTGNLLFDKGGWQICPKLHLLKMGIKERELDANGNLRRGQLVLAFMPKKMWEEKEQFKQDKANKPVAMIKRLIDKGDSTSGVGIHPTMKGIQTKRQLGM